MVPLLFADSATSALTSNFEKYKYKKVGTKHALLWMKKYFS
jgi:hypothetical protein